MQWLRDLFGSKSVEAKPEVNRAKRKKKRPKGVVISKPAVKEPIPDPFAGFVSLNAVKPPVSHHKLLLWNGSYIRWGRYLAVDMGANFCQFYDDWDNPIRGKQITHWMYCPTPPDVKGNPEWEPLAR